ncbi:hypothetical protein ABMA28_010235 [Loxostege sticticalis]|uniref:Uncharacterized protein n=1 Tax=Loxostege sticticalis TaxID=481309 RepID=A0ABD0SA49_LOXSC
MEHLTLSGDTLGERQRHYNQLLKKQLDNYPQQVVPWISYNDNDIDNFMKIDIACHNRDINYILKVLRCKDMLYITRVIKKCRWLIIDNEYSNIITPKYLHKELFPYMMSKAKSKLILHIRLHLRDEKRVKDFYKYFKQFDLSSALKWLPQCPLEFALDEVSKHASDIRPPILKRLYKRSFLFLQIIANAINDYRREHFMEAALFLLRNHTEEYLDISDSTYWSEVPHLKIKFLKIIMKVCPQRILDNFSHYISKIDHPTCIKYIEKESIKPFLLNCFKEDKLRYQFSHEILCHYLIRLPFDDRLDLLKAYRSNKTQNINCKGPDGLNLLFSAIEGNASFNSSNVFRWYQCMPFVISFRELTKIIRTELKSDVRHSMFGILLICAGSNSDEIFTLLKYYHDNHINEPFKFKINFLNDFLSVVKAYKFDTEMWTILDNLFCSMEVYMNSNLKVKKCIQTIIIYKTIHDEPIPEIVETKFIFETLRYYKNKLNIEEGEKLFNYLLENQVRQLENAIENVSNENVFREIIIYLGNIMKLVADWNKHIESYSFILDKIKECIKIKISNSWKTDLSSLYHTNKSLQTHLVDDSLSLNACEKVLLNALKYNQSLFKTYIHEVDLVRYDDTKSLGKLLSKLKIYWPDCLAKDWAEDYLKHLNQIGQQKVVIKSLAALLSQEDFLNIAKLHIPEEKKIIWSETNELDYSLRKYFAMNIHKVRPLPAPKIVLWFAKGDYLKFAVPSLSATLANVSNVDKETYIPELVNVPVSLQKHGIRMAFAKLEVEKLVPIFETIWKSTTNCSIRTLLFISTHRILCKEKRQSKVLKLWKFLSGFVEILSNSENEIIYKKLNRIEEVPQIIRSEYCMKAYLYFKKLPENLAQEYTLNMLRHHSKEMIEILDDKFIEDEILKSLDFFPSKPREIVDLLAMYLLSSKDKETEIKKYERLFKPLIDNAECNSSQNFGELTDFLYSGLKYYVLSSNGIIPLSIYRSLLNHYREKNTLPGEYVALTTWELKHILIEIIDRVSQTKGNIDIFTTVAPEFGKVCIKQLQKDIKTYFSSIYMLFEHALANVFNSFRLETAHQLHVFKNMLKDQYTVESYYLVQKMLPSYVISSDKQLKMEIVEILCTHPSEEFQMLCRYHYPDQVHGRQMSSNRWSDTCILI